MIKIGRKEEEKSVQQNKETEISTSTQNSITAQQSVLLSENLEPEVREGKLSGYVGNGTIVSGEITFKALMRIDGHLKGKIYSEEGTLIVGASGRVEANISVGSAIISGNVVGDIIASKKVELGKTASVTGNIQAPRLKIEDGATFEGSCTMLKKQDTSNSKRSLQDQ